MITSKPSRVAHGVIFLILSAVCLCVISYAQQKDIPSTDARLQQLETQLAELRRDQLNYRIEKDLLKETYSSNYQTINFIFTIILGIFGFLSFFGYRDIGNLKKEYSAGLERLNQLRGELEVKVKEIAKEQEQVKSNYIAIIKTNEEQSRRIKVLELQEKIGSLIHGQNYQRAMEYVTIALDLDPANIILLYQKATALWKLGNLSGAAAAYVKLIELEPSNEGAISNLLELYLIMNQTEDYKGLFNKNRAMIESKDGGLLKAYFDVLQSYQLGDETTLGNAVKEGLTLMSKKGPGRITWNFDDVRTFMTIQPQSRGKSLLEVFVNCLSENIDAETARDIVAKLEQAEGSTQVSTE